MRCENWPESKVMSVTLDTEGKIEWDLLGEHLKLERSWHLLGQWKKALAAHLEARIAMKRMLANLLQEKTECQLVDLPDQRFFSILFFGRLSFSTDDSAVTATCGYQRLKQQYHC